MKKALTWLLALGIAATTLSAFPATAAGALLQTDFESGLDGWTGRGDATVEVTTSTASGGSQSAAVTNREKAWSGISHTLDTAVFQPGTAYSFSAMLSQSATVQAIHFKLSLQYSTGGDGGGFGGMFPGMGGNTTYACIAEGDVASGMWTTLSNPSYTIPEGATDLVLYIETEDSLVDFFVDDIVVAAAGETVIVAPPSPNTKLGDVNGDGNVNKADADALRDHLLNKKPLASANGADMNADGSLDARDLSLLKARIMNPPAETTTVTTTTTAPPETTTEAIVTTTNGGSSSQGTANAKEYMEKVAATITKDVPGNVKQGDNGKTEHFEYMSQKAGHNKGAYVWLPPGYSADKKYNVMYMNHGIFGDESSMLTGFSVREMASNMIQSGEAEPFIIIFTQMYTDPATKGSPGFGINMDVMDHYDDFVFDLRDSLMPYVQEHWSVMTGREHTAIAGFSMGGRESLYCGMMLPDLIGYVCASSPAPGIVPASDNFLSNHLGSYNLERTKRMTEADFKYSDSDLPYLLMIGGGTNDGVVGTFPKQYHEIYDKNGTKNIWLEVAGGGHDGSVGTPLFYNYFKNVFKA